MGNFCEAAELLGDAEASVLVSAEGLFTAGNGGSSLEGIGGIGFVWAWS